MLIEETSDPYLERMKASREGTGTLKLRLITFRAVNPKVAIFAFEGDDDKIIYAQWIGREQPMLKYEPFPCKGKDGVLALFGVVQRDLADLGKNVYFFVDRDFDELRGLEPHQSIFMTDAYSVENYLVSERVLVDLLRNEFHCHERMDVREDIQQVFATTYAAFLSVTKEVNSRIFIARRLMIKLKHQLPTRINSIARVELRSVQPAEQAAEDLVVYFRMANTEDAERCREEFGQLDPKHRYRGKFALLFFQRWLAELVVEFNKKGDGLFARIVTTSRVREVELVMSNFASKSALPAALPDFLASVAAQQ